MSRFSVKSDAITVLEKRESAVARLSKGLKKDQVLSDILPDAWQQGEYVNVVVTKGTVLDSNTYEINRLEQLRRNGYIDLLEGESAPTVENEITTVPEEAEKLPVKRGRVPVKAKK